MAFDIHNLSMALLLNFSAKFELTTFRFRHKHKCSIVDSRCNERDNMRQTDNKNEKNSCNFWADAFHFGIMQRN